MRAILIDPFAMTVTETEYNGDYRHIYKLIDCDIFTVVNISEDKNGNRESIFIDDEGLLKEPTHFFAWSGYHQPLAGKGLILGCDAEGESIGTKLNLRQAQNSVSFLQLSLSGFEEEDGEIEMFGEKMRLYRQTPIFGPPKIK